jgi:hypothetical protein
MNSSVKASNCIKICLYISLIILLTNAKASKIQRVDQSFLQNESDTAKHAITDSIKVKYWKYEGSLLLNFSQMWFENWAVGGDKAIAGNSYEDFMMKYKKDKVTWETTFKVSEGLIKQQGYRLVNTDDKLEVYTKYGRKLSKKWNYSAYFSFQSQIFPGFKSPQDTIKLSDFLSPAYFNTSIGADFRPTEKFSILFSPLAGKITLVTSDFIMDYYKVSNGTYGVSPGNHTRYELGGSIVISAKGEIFKNIIYQTNINAFSNYEKDPSQFDWNCEFLLSMKLNKFMSANLKTNLLYDIETSLDPQFKEFFGIGFSYKI